MTVFYFDGTFEGVLTAVFDSYFRKTFPDRLLVEGDPGPLFAETAHHVITDVTKSSRVWKGVEKRSSRRVCNMLMHLWLSEQEDVAITLYKCIRTVFDSDIPITVDYTDPTVITAKELAHKVAREGRYLVQFIRFQKTSDGTFFAPVSPRYNALPLAINYLKDRFADQSWLVYDIKRKYGFYYDLHEVREVTLPDDGMVTGGKLNSTIMDADEVLFQRMWRSYFRSISIKERINPRLHRKNMPRRFWGLLTEKDSGGDL